MEKIRILFLINSLENGGAENVLVNLVNNLNTSIFEITVQTVFDTGINKTKLHDYVRYKSFLKKPFKGNSALFALLPSKVLFRAMVNEKYDIVVSYLQGVTAHILAGCNDMNIKRVAWIHTAFSNDKELQAGFKSKKEALLTYNSCDKIVFVANSVQSRFEEIAGQQFTHGTVLYNTIESGMILQKSKDPMDDIQFFENEINIVSVGKIIEYKGYDRLVRIHNRLKSEGISLHIYIIGEGPQRPEIEKLIRDNELESSFTLLGFKENPYKYVAKADLFVCSSYREGFSTAVTESLIVGTPVVSTNCSGAYELLGENNEYGIVTENTEDSLFQGIKKLLINPLLLKEYKTKAVERGKEFSKERTVKAVENMFLTLRKE